VWRISSRVVEDEELGENNFILKKRVFGNFVEYNIYRFLKIKIKL